MEGYQFVSIEGNIGSGKTTLSTKLAEALGAKLILERFEDNPFLASFYANPDRYSFHVELSFLAERYTHLIKEMPSTDLFKSLTISDYMFQKCLIFANSTLKSSEFDLYAKLYRMVESILPKPELILYLHRTTDNLLKNIAKRGRPYEQQISSEYLNQINDGYMQYFRQHPHLKVVMIDMSQHDIMSSAEDLQFFKDLLTQDFAPGITRL